MAKTKVVRIDEDTQAKIKKCWGLLTYMGRGEILTLGDVIGQAIVEMEHRLLEEYEERKRR